MEEQFKKKLSIVKVDWDKEQLWQELEPKLPTKKKKRIWFGLIFFFLVGLGAILWLYLPVPDSSGNTQLLEGSNLQLDGQSHEVISGQKHEPAISRVEALDQNNFPAPSKKPKPPYKLMEYPKQSALTKDTSIAPQNHFSVIRDTSTITYTEKSLVGTTQNRAFSFSNTGNIKPLLLLPDALSFRLKSNSKELPELERIPEAGMQQHPGFFLDIEMGGGQLSRSVSFMEQNVDVLAILEKNKAAEKPFLLVSADLGLGYQLKSGAFIKSGLQYRRIQEHLDWEKVLTSSNFLLDYEKAFFQVISGRDTIFYGGPVESQSIEKRKIFHKNNTTIFTIPLEIGFEKRIKSVHLSALAGVNIALFTDFNGRMINLNDEVLEHPEIELDNRLGYYFGLGLGYQITQKSTLFLKSTFDQSSTVLINQAKQDYQSINLRLGIRTFLKH